MEETEFEVGDILIKYNIHALMWVGGTTPIAHNSMEGKGVSGVVKTTASNYFQKITSFEKYPLTVIVYRLSPPNTTVAQLAAQHAVNWSTEFDINLFTEDPTFVLKSPLHGKRLLAAETNGTQEFNINSLLRAIKAIARGQTGLSPHNGTACSSFVTYCYQSAFLETFVGDTIVGDVQRILQLHEGRLGKITNLFDQTANLKEDALRVLLGKAQSTLPAAVLKDAKTMHIEEFQQRLDEPKSGFQVAGYAAYHNGKLKMFTCDDGEESKVKWSDVVMQIFDDLT